jgi:hypothetical protein
MWIGVILICTNLHSIHSCQAMVRNTNLFESEKECRETVPGELDQMLAKFGGWGHSNCLPLPTYGVAL